MKYFVNNIVDPNEPFAKMGVVVDKSGNIGVAYQSSAHRSVKGHEIYSFYNKTIVIPKDSYYNNCDFIKKILKYFGNKCKKIDSLKDYHTIYVKRPMDGVAMSHKSMLINDILIRIFDKLVEQKDPYWVIKNRYHVDMLHFIAAIKERNEVYALNSVLASMAIYGSSKELKYIEPKVSKKTIDFINSLIEKDYQLYFSKLHIYDLRHRYTPIWNSKLTNGYDHYFYRGRYDYRPLKWKPTIPVDPFIIHNEKPKFILKYIKVENGYIIKKIKFPLYSCYNSRVEQKVRNKLFLLLEEKGTALGIYTSGCPACNPNEIIRLNEILSENKFNKLINYLNEYKEVLISAIKECNAEAKKNIKNFKVKTVNI
jgi:hypothetical protein